VSKGLDSEMGDLPALESSESLDEADQQKLISRVPETANQKAEPKGIFI